MNRFKWHFITVLLLIFSSVLSANIIGSVSRVKGTSQIDRRGSLNFISLWQDILQDDIISTKRRSFVIVNMIDGGIVNIGEESIFGFKRYLYNQRVGRGKAYLLIQRGYFRIITGDIARVSPQRFRVDTKTAVIGLIRGADFYGFIDGEYEDIGCLDGDIFVDTESRRFHLKAAERVVKKKNQDWQRVNFPEALYRIGSRHIIRQQRVLRGEKCKKGEVWSKYLRKCIMSDEVLRDDSSRGEVIETPPQITISKPKRTTIECPNSMVPDENMESCVCPRGKTWSKIMQDCVTIEQRKDFCNKNFPGTVPALTERECECRDGFWWSEKNRRCLNPVEYCQDKIPNSVPTITIDNKIDCQCPKGYFFGKRTKKCYKKRYRKPRPQYQPRYQPHQQPRTEVEHNSDCQSFPVRNRRPIHHRPIEHRPIYDYNPTYREEVRHHNGKYIVPALIGTAVIAGAIISKKHHRHKHKKRKKRDRDNRHRHHTVTVKVKKTLRDIDGKRD